MKTKLISLLLFTLFAIKMSAQEKSGTAVCFGERVIDDYLSYYETQQKEYPDLYQATHLWFEDSDTRQIVSDFINSYADSLTTDTIFFIHGHNIAWGETNTLEIVPGDTMLGVYVKWLEGGYRSFKAYRTPFLNDYSNVYWEDLCKWDTAQFSKPTKCIVLDGSYYYLVRLIYHKGLLVSAEYYDHDSKAEYDAVMYDPAKDVILQYPEGKRWPKIY